MIAQPITLIAEAGVNHNGDIALAFDLIDIAAEAGADYVKFQTFDAKKMVSKSASLAPYQKKSQKSGRNQLDMLLELQFDQDTHRKLVKHCNDRGIGFLSTPFDMVSLSMLVDDLELDILKIGSGDLTNAPLLYSAAQSDSKIILSTGMGSLGQIEQTLGLLALGYSKDGPKNPSREDMLTAWATTDYRELLKDKVTLLHCVTNYPASLQSTNLRTLAVLSHAFDLPTGYSDHTFGSSACISAAALGATCIEKHLTMDRSLPGPDHAASSDPDELKAIFKSVREVEQLLGTSIKACVEEERKNLSGTRKCLIAAKDIEKGEEFTTKNLTTMRAACGGDPMSYFEMLGKLAKRDIAQGAPINE